jgi:hypothetical protein
MPHSRRSVIRMATAGCFRKSPPAFPAVSGDPLERYGLRSVDHPGQRRAIDTLDRRNLDLGFACDRVILVRREVFPHHLSRGVTWKILPCIPSVMSVFPLGKRCALLTNELKKVHGGLPESSAVYCHTMCLVTGSISSTREPA